MDGAPRDDTEPGGPGRDPRPCPTVLREARWARTRRRAASAVAAVISASSLAACGAASPGGTAAAGSCVAHRLSAQSGVPADRVVVARGQQVTVHGEDYFLPCQDALAPGQALTRASPVPAVPLTLVERDGRTRPLATAHPDASGAFTLVLSVPRDALPGRAALQDPGGQRLELEIR